MSIDTDEWKYIDELAERLGLSSEKKDKPFFTKPLYLRLYSRMWTQDFHDYRHEGSRVDASTLLNTHCYTSARLSELCAAVYKVSDETKRNNSCCIDKQ
jgi:hypothetical protein